MRAPRKASKASLQREGDCTSFQLLVFHQRLVLYLNPVVIIVNA